ncbi:MAG: helix-turn-helix domain-containing protein [Acutalibacter sp.]
MLRDQYEEHSERDLLWAPLATYHFQRTIIPLHWHREVELILPQCASSLELEGKLWPFQPGELLCINKGVLHRTREPIRADLLVLDLRILLSPLLRQEEGLFLNRLEEGTLTFPFRVEQSCPGYGEMVQAFRRCVTLLDDKSPGWELPMQRELMTLLGGYQENGLLVEAGLQTRNPQAEAVKGSIAYMRAHFSRELTLQQLAEQAALSPSHYIRVFRRCTGQTPFAFLNDLRMEEAARCLEQAMTVSETAQRVGVPNLSYFIRLFRKRFGRTPKQYQLEQAGR